jgi:hypothetical protein
MAATRFVTDTSLALLARRLRFVGYDVAGVDGARLGELFLVAREEGRTVLTLSARHPKAFADVPAIQVPRNDPAAGLRLIAENHEAASLPFSRCPRCNHALQKRSAFEAHGEVPGRVLRSAKSLQYCPSCAKWFWYGSHVRNVSRWLSEVLGRDVHWPHDPPESDLVEPS